MDKFCTGCKKDLPERHLVWKTPMIYFTVCDMVCFEVAKVNLLKWTQEHD